MASPILLSPPPPPPSFSNEYGLETNGGSNNQDPAKIGVGIVDEQPASLDSLSNGGRKTPLDGIGFKASTCNCAGRFSCLRTMTALYLIARIGICSYSIFEEIASDFLSGGLEDHILCSLSLLIERKASGRDSVNFLRLLGIPSFDENSIPGCLRHLNIALVLGLLKTSGYINLMLPKTPYTLENILHFSPNALKSEWHIRFLMYQLLSALAYLHGLDVAHGNICPSSVMLTDSCWSWLSFSDKPFPPRQ
ncbi:hypothetical protein LWI29_035898 [Acer saccharum]|uniref:Protein kinase domain-containing protein n=1 Tax=Acer saccharum TaxID=4024 RepID=A0AA39RJR5_ACESA|nr:hypothetical protein LWI29_035898 [Acer saccharum]